MAVPLLTILAAKAKFVRYSYPLWPALAVLVGLLVQQIATRCRDGGPRRWRAFEVAAAGAIGGLVVYALLVVPNGGAYANPVLGGGPVAQEVMTMSSDLQTEAGYFIRDREGDRCAERRIFANSFRKWFPCGEVVTSASELRRGDYIVLAGESDDRNPEAAKALRRAGAAGRDGRDPRRRHRRHHPGAVTRSDHAGGITPVLVERGGDRSEPHRHRLDLVRGGVAAADRGGGPGTDLASQVRVVRRAGASNARRARRRDPPRRGPADSSIRRRSIVAVVASVTRCIE